VPFYVNYSLQKCRKRKRNIQEPDLSETTHLAREQETFNEQHRGLRSRVEAPFGQWKQHCVALGNPWTESWVQQDYVVYIVAAIHNVQKQ
jgi:hypothetical protein